MVSKTFIPKSDKHGIPHYGREKPDPISENALQEHTAIWLATQYRKVKCAHIANERSGKTSMGQIMKLKRQGMKFGIPDWIFFFPAVGFIELKVEGGSLKPTQVEFLLEMQAVGLPIAVCWSLDSFMFVVNKWYGQ